jgi:hypothetical protein
LEQQPLKNAVLQGFSLKNRKSLGLSFHFFRMSSRLFLHFFPAHAQLKQNSIPGPYIVCDKKEIERKAQGTLVHIRLLYE